MQKKGNENKNADGYLQCSKYNGPSKVLLNLSNYALLRMTENHSEQDFYFCHI